MSSAVRVAYRSAGGIGSAAGHSVQLCGDRKPPAARAVSYPHAWTVDLTDALMSENGYAKEVTVYPQTAACCGPYRSAG